MIKRHLEEHRRQTEQLRAQADKVDIVITHCPPTKQAVAPRFADSLLNGYFVNDREDLVEEIGADLWISGHVHDPYDCVVGGTYCVANPTGYPGEVPEVGEFGPDRVIEVYGSGCQQAYCLTAFDSIHAAPAAQQKLSDPTLPFVTLRLESLALARPRHPHAACRRQRRRTLPKPRNRFWAHESVPQRPRQVGLSIGSER